MLSLVVSGCVMNRCSIFGVVRSTFLVERFVVVDRCIVVQNRFMVYRFLVRSCAVVVAMSALVVLDFVVHVR